MEEFISLQNVANIVTFLAPGYFAMQMYQLMYGRREREFSHTFVESVVYSLPLVALANLVWEKLIHHQVMENLNGEYAILLIALSIVCGTLVGRIRGLVLIQNLLEKVWHVELYRVDFLQKQLLRLDNYDRNKSAITVTLKSGGVFSGTVDQLSRSPHEGQLYCSFTNLAWFNPSTGKWDERKGNLIISRSEIEFIETPELRVSASEK